MMVAEALRLAGSTATEAGYRTGFVLFIVAVIGLGLWGMVRGWRARGMHQADLAVLPPVPELTGRYESVVGQYIATTSSGDWLDRIVVGGLGNRGRAMLVVVADGVLIRRDGETAIWIAREAITDVVLGQGLAQKVFEPGGLIIMTWTLGGVSLDTGFRADDPVEHVAVAHLIAGMFKEGSDAH